MGLALAAAFYLAGGHWATLQAVAWSGMLVKYSSTSGLWVGLQQTFDGDHPCPLCLAIRRAQQNRQAPDQLTSTAPEARLLATTPATPERDLGMDPTGESLLDPTFRVASHRDQPPVPPPRHPAIRST